MANDETVSKLAMPPAEFYEKLLHWFPVPAFAVDLHQAGHNCRARWLSSPTEISLPLGPASPRDVAKEGALRVLVSAVPPHPKLVDLFASAPVVRDGFKKGRELKQSTHPAFKSVTRRHGQTLIWRTSGVWAAGYGRFLEQMLNIMNSGQARIEGLAEGTKLNLNETGFSGENVDLADQFSRVMPTLHHYAASSLGAWIGGAINMQYLSHWATNPQIRRPDDNLQYAASMGYTKKEAEALTSGGLIAVPEQVTLNMAMAQQSIQVVGGISVDEFNIANEPSAGILEEARGERDLQGLLIDRQYRAAFWRRPLAGQALYGAQTVARDHYAEFYAARSSVGMLRCKHYSAPIYEVRSVEELRALAAAIPKRSNEGVVFRGQTKLYLLNRPQPIKRMLFGTSCADEPSFPSSAARQGFDYDSLHYQLLYYLENFGLDFPRIPGSLGSDIYEQWRSARVSPSCEVDYAVMALAQHYGLPSHGLDVTEDLEVAVWFATNAYRTESDGLADYTALSPKDWPSDPKDWPVVAMLQPATQSLTGSLQNCHELDAFGMSALRPQRQKARFFLGGHADHQNRLAEAVVCIARLAPSDYCSPLSFEHLFPSPDEDPAYRTMLDFAKYQPFWPQGSRGVAKFRRWISEEKQ
ncbi:FRG domain-containing protein [Leisingera aquaemixtae]|uniref:FRG domain-containing protein n=1 Tax=Leisingera aquaemixtae TaxID=1396826 RepID=UPI0021A66288|nr:FRG domain-containing protein [Leisingera aquaemixtae]UWQ38205.1 FRG domain-containing protein [Leisingera aquaemixtae]